jgi:hypothetical protein
MRRSAPPSTLRRTARRGARGSLAAVTRAITPAHDETARSSVDAAPPDALSFVASLVDLRSAVELSRVLESAGSPFEDRAPSATAMEAARRALATIEVVERTIEELDFRTLPRAKALTAASMLGTLRGSGVLDSPQSGIDRAVRALWGPFSTFVIHQATRAQADIDDAVSLARASLAASSPRAQRLLSLHEVLERMVSTRRATLLDRPVVKLAAAFGEAIVVAVSAIDGVPTEHDLAPWLATDGLVARHLDLAQSLLRAIVRHHARPARALISACIAPVIHSSSPHAHTET